LSSHSIKLAFLVVLAEAIALVPAKSSADHISTGIIAMFPKEMAEFVYTDLKSARQYPWFTEFREQVVPPHFQEFEQLLSFAGIDAQRSVDELAWGELRTSAKAGHEVIGIGIGAFDPTFSEERLKQQGLHITNYKDFHFYSSGRGDILFTFLDTSMAAFGHRLALEKLVDLRMGLGETLLANDTLFALIREANGAGIIWAVFDRSYAHRAIGQLIPQAAAFPQAAAIINRMKALTISVDADSGLDARFQAVCDSVDDANLFGAALEAAVMYRRYREEQTPNDLMQDVLENIRVTPSGDRLTVEGSVSQDELGALIKGSVLAAPM